MAAEEEEEEGGRRQNMYSLYVGDVHPRVSEGQFIEAFSSIDGYVSAVLCQDGLTGNSRCYGYVNFNTLQHANMAIETMNHKFLNGKAIRVMWSNQNSEARQSGIGNVFVKNLDDSVDILKLQEIFSKYGKILSCKLAMSQDGKSKGHGFVQFESVESANNAIEQASGCIIGGKELYVTQFKSRNERYQANSETKYTNLYIKNLDQTVTEERLKEKFSEYGNIASLVILKDSNGASKGFGFVCFENPDDAKRAQESMNGQELGSKTLYVARAQKKAEREQILRLEYEERRKEAIQRFKDLNVYVKNINEDVDENQLQEHFRQCGTVRSIKIMLDKKGISKGFGFVCFSTPEEAKRAVEKLHGNMFHGKPLFAVIAQSKEERMAFLQRMFQERSKGFTGLSGAFSPAMCPAPYPHTSQIHPGQQFMLQPPMGLRPTWINGVLPAARPFFCQPPMFPMVPPNFPGQYRPNAGWLNEQMRPNGAAYPLPDMLHLQQNSQFANSRRNSRYQQWNKNKLNGNLQTNNGPPSAAVSHTTAAQELEKLSSILTAASPEQRKTMLGERLYPLVEKLERHQASKITGMLLEMDNVELLLLLESPQSLATKVEEAAMALLSKD